MDISSVRGLYLEISSFGHVTGDIDQKTTQEGDGHCLFDGENVQMFSDGCTFEQFFPVVN